MKAKLSDLIKLKHSIIRQIDELQDRLSDIENKIKLCQKGYKVKKELEMRLI